MRLQVKRRRLLAIAALVLVLMFVAFPLYVAYASLHPDRCPITDTPADYGLEYENVTVTTGDGVTLRGWVIPGSEGGPVAIIMHGYTSCKASPDLLELAAALHELGYNVVMFDFRGHGESEGTTTIGPREARYDAPAIIGYAADRFPGAPIVLIGYSMGAVVAIMAGAGDERVSVIVADSPYPVLEQVIPRWLKAKMGVPEWYSRVIGAYGSLLAGESLRFGPMLLDRVDKPLLVIAGDRDPLVTPEEAREIAAKSPTGEALIVPGAGHVEAAEKLGLDQYVEKIDSFVSEHLGG